MVLSNAWRASLPSTIGGRSRTERGASIIRTSVGHVPGGSSATIAAARIPPPLRRHRCNRDKLSRLPGIVDQSAGRRLCKRRPRGRLHRLPPQYPDLRFRPEAALRPSAAGWITSTEAARPSGIAIPAAFVGNRSMRLPEFVAHADWSANPPGRKSSIARRVGARYTVTSPARHSAAPVARLARPSTTKPSRFSISAWPI